jgi:hypothetical protein
MPARGARWLLLAAAVVVVLAVLVQGALVGLVPGPAPTAIPSGPIACGEEMAGYNQSLDAEARACFWAAYEQHRPASFTTIKPTIEGDPISWTYRVLEGGAVEITVDSTKDKFGSGEIVVMDCPDLIRTDTPVLSDPIQFEPGSECVERPKS